MQLPFRFYVSLTFKYDQWHHMHSSTLGVNFLIPFQMVDFILSPRYKTLGPKFSRLRKMLFQSDFLPGKYYG